MYIVGIELKIENKNVKHVVLLRLIQSPDFLNYELL